MTSYSACAARRSRWYRAPKSPPKWSKRELNGRIAPPAGSPGRIVHFVTGDVLAYKHTAEVIGGVEGDLIPLDVTHLPAKHGYP